ncbi:MAG: PP2C family protein-serine/threonine phosphatase [Balneola sp.]
MFSIHDQRFRDILLLVLGFFGALWFFYDLGNHHPLGPVEIKISEEEAIQQADSIFLNWQYQPVNLKKRARVSSYSDLVDFLQDGHGRAEFVYNMKKQSGPKLPLYNWLVEEFSVQSGEIKKSYSARLSKQGDLITFDVEDELIEQQTPFNRAMIRFAYSRGRAITKAFEDSIITRLVNFQHMRDDPESSLEFIRTQLQSSEEYHSSYIWEGIDYYIQNTYWSRFEFQRDSVSFNDNGRFRFAKAYLTSKDTLMGVIPKLEVELLPAGVVKSLNVSLDEGIPKVSNFNPKRLNILTGVSLFFGVWLLISFYLRIKARAVDTRPALVVAVICGFLVPLLLVLQYVREFALSFDSEQLSSVLSVMFSFGVAGALSATGFFVITAVSDSVTRQYWPSQLKTWDLVRRGMFKNKPIGWAIIRAISIGSILAGAFSIVLNFFPELYIRGNILFYNDTFSLSPVANIIITLLLGLSFVLVCFLIVGNQLYALTAKKWIIPFASGFCFALIDLVPIDMAPMLPEFFMNFILGFLIGVFYVNFDFLTIALGFFIFLNFLTTSKGWLVSGSPDEPIFIGFFITMIIFSGIALYFLFVGEEKDHLPEYVPEYIEDLAKEERVKQELDIARTVQNTFLPSTTPNIPGFDSAAVCYPAQETGGDYYDIICLDDDRAAIAIGDVSGKGIQAAFYMTFIKGVIHSLCSIFPSPKSMLFRVNKLFNQHATRGTFISMIYGVLDSSEKTFTYIRAGHNPMLYKSNGMIEWKQPRGVAIGMSKGDAFNKVMEEDTIKFEEGDVLVLYTDGITEAQNEKGEFYDEKRLLKLLKREKTNSSKELRDLIIEDVRTFIGDTLQYDDMTLVVIKG